MTPTVNSLLLVLRKPFIARCPTDSFTRTHTGRDISLKSSNYHRYFQSQALIDSKLVNEFASKNANLARAALKTPKINLDNNINTTDTTSMPTSLDEYLKWRGWESKYVQHEMTNALLSHALTFPLTLAYHANHFLQDDKNHSSHSHSQSVKNINLCCVGSRAEANLPDEYWREFLIATNRFHFDPSRSSSNQRIHWTIDCIGPEISSHLKTRHIHIINNEDEDEDSKSETHTPCIPHSTLTLNYHKGLLHNHVLDVYKSDKGEGNVNVNAILQKWDGFILFNPGIGHPHLESSWKPSVDFMLKTKQRILTTAHSEVDSERDWKVWKRGLAGRMQGEGENRSVHTGMVGYERNSFASIMSFEDPFPTQDGATRVSPNYSICKF